MPSAAPRICPCQKVIPYGQRCACEKKRDAERKTRHDAKRPSASERGYGGKWQQARADYLAANPVCVRCGKPATVVNHKRPHKGDFKLFWSRSNWEPVCNPCHSGPIQSEEKRLR